MARKLCCWDGAGWKRFRSRQRETAGEGIGLEHRPGRRSLPRAIDRSRSSLPAGAPALLECTRSARLADSWLFTRRDASSWLRARGIRMPQFSPRSVVMTNCSTYQPYHHGPLRYEDTNHSYFSLGNCTREQRASLVKPQLSYLVNGCRNRYSKLPGSRAFAEWPSCFFANGPRTTMPDPDAHHG